jgi:hypothetical protein
MKTLFELTEEFVDLEYRLDALDDSDEAGLQELLDWMQSLGNQRQEKIDAYGWLIRKLESEAVAAKAIAAEFQSKARSRESRIDLLKDMIRTHMLTVGERKLLGHKFTVALQKNGGALPVEIVDEEAIPVEFCEMKKVPVKTLIREAIEAGGSVPGAYLAERGESVRIK